RGVARAADAGGVLVRPPQRPFGAPGHPRSAAAPRRSAAVSFPGRRSGAAARAVRLALLLPARRAGVPRRVRSDRFGAPARGLAPARRREEAARVRLGSARFLPRAPFAP